MCFDNTWELFKVNYSCSKVNVYESLFKWNAISCYFMRMLRCIQHFNLNIRDIGDKGTYLKHPFKMI